MSGNENRPGANRAVVGVVASGDASTTRKYSTQGRSTGRAGNGVGVSSAAAAPGACDNRLLQVALTARAAGLCVVPPRTDGSKRRLGDSWTRWQTERPSVEQIREWYADGHPGMGLVCGAVSGNLEVLDFDNPDAFNAFLKIADQRGLGSLVERVRNGYEEETPKGGIHWPYCCSNIAGNTKLARRPTGGDEHGNPKVDVLIETRAEGGYIVVAPSCGPVHPSGKPYRLLRGGMATIATITPEEREALHQLARSLDEMPKPKAEDAPPGRPRDFDTKPGDDFNRRATWGEILEPKGWKRTGSRGETELWQRPGKDARESHSATTNHAGSDLFYCFSTSTAFDSERGYSKFAVYTTLNHGGDFRASAKDLAGRGYGKSGTSNGHSSAPMSATPIVTANSDGSTQRPPQRQMAFSADALLDADLPEAKWLVPGMITEGLVILAGRPKMGKSWLALLLALTVGIGGVFLGQRVKKGKVVYFALEDSPKRLKRRMNALGWARGADVQFYFNLDPLGGTLEGRVRVTFPGDCLPVGEKTAGGPEPVSGLPERVLQLAQGLPGNVTGTLEGLPAFIDAIQPDLVIIDTSSRAMPAGAKTRDTDMITKMLDPIQQSAVQGGCTVLMIDHYRKTQGMAPESVDHLEEVMDSTAKVAVADTIIGLARKRGERGATLKITGRDLEEDVELAIEHDRDTGCWQLIGDAGEVRQSERQRKVIAALRTFNAFTAGTTEIAERAGLPKSHTSAVLQELVDGSLVERLPKQGREQPYRLIVPNTSNNGNSSNHGNGGNNGNHSEDGPDSYHCYHHGDSPEAHSRHDDYHNYHDYHGSDGSDGDREEGIL